MSNIPFTAIKRPGWLTACAGAAALAMIFGVMTAKAGLGPESAREYFMVKEIVVEGLNRIPEEEVGAILNIKPGTGIFSVDLLTAGRRLESHPLVASVEIRRKLPSALHVKVTERKPSYSLLAGGQSWLMDDFSVAVSPAHNEEERRGLPFIGLESLDGVKIRPGLKITSGSVREMASAAQLLKGYKLFGRHEFLGLWAHGPERMAAGFEGSSAIVIARTRGWTDEIRRLKAMETLLRGKEDEISEIDLSFADKAVVRRRTAGRAGVGSEQ